MGKTKQKTARKVQSRIARHKSVRYHNDSRLFPINKPEATKTKKHNTIER